MIDTHSKFRMVEKISNEIFKPCSELVLKHNVRLGTKNQNKLSELGLHNPSVIFDTNSIFVGAKVMSKFILDYLT